MRELTPAQASRALDLAVAELPLVLRGVLERAAVRIGADAVGRMRDAKGEGRRDPDDDGPLRIVTGTHAAATVADGPNRQGAINRISLAGVRLELEKGYDTSIDPGAINEVWDEREEYRTLAPALDAQEDDVRRHARRQLGALLNRAVGSAGPGAVHA